MDRNEPIIKLWVEQSGMDVMIHIPISNLKFVPSAQAGPLAWKDLFSEREQILSWKSAIPKPWKEEEIIPASPLPVHSIPCFKPCRAPDKKE